MLIDVQIKRAEGRRVYLLAKGVTFEVVHQYRDTEIEGTLAKREVLSVSVEGDIPMTLKAVLADCFQFDLYVEANRWIEEYLA